MTCDNCFDSKHWKCHENCGCGYCYGEKPTSPKGKDRPPQKDMSLKRKAARSKRGLEARLIQERYGVITKFSREQIQQIFDGKAAGQSMSELARTMGTTRDRVRTVYNSTKAPILGIKPSTPKTSCPTCKRDYDKDLAATI